jgi:hypothetical protein
VLVLPGNLDAGDSRFRPYPLHPVANAVMGEEFRGGGPWRSALRRARLIVGKNGVSGILPPGESTTVRWERCAAISAWRDGTRCLWDEGGFLLYVWPQLWRNGEKATRLVEELAPADLIVDMGDEPPPQPW